MKRVEVLVQRDERKARKMKNSTDANGRGNGLCGNGQRGTDVITGKPWARGCQHLKTDVNHKVCPVCHSKKK